MVVRRFQDRVYGLALAMTGNATDAEEVSQDTFLGVFKGLPAFRGDASLGTWIYRVAANAALMIRRKKRRKPALSLEDARPEFAEDEAGHVRTPGAWVLTPDEAVLSGELKRLIETAITELSDKYRLVLLLKDVEGFTNEEAAETLGLTIPTVKARLHRARLIVRDELDHYFTNR